MKSESNLVSVVIWLAAIIMLVIIIFHAVGVIGEAYEPIIWF